MRLPKFLDINNGLALAIYLERWFGIPWVWFGTGLPAPEVPWYVFVIEMSAADIVWLMEVCADVGGKFARSDLLLLNAVLEEMRTP
jgi:hypothetical protein